MGTGFVYDGIIMVLGVFVGSVCGDLAVLRDDAHAEVERHVDEEQRVGEDVEALPAQAVHPVQEGDLHGDADQVEERDGHHAHDVVTPGQVTTRSYLIQLPLR